MDFKEFVKFTDSTAIYPRDKELEYLGLGIFSEVGEVAGVVKKFLRDATPQSQLKEKIVSETCDCLWYIARLVKFFGLVEVFDREISQKTTMMSAFAKKSIEDVSLDLLVKASGTAIAINSYYKVIMQYKISNTVMSVDSLKENIKVNLLELYYNMAVLLKMMNYDIKDLCEVNQKKLLDRQKRDKLGGSGDNR